jgi:hypothetical protein
MVFDCQSNLRRASVQAHGTEDPAAFRGLCSTWNIGVQQHPGRAGVIAQTGDGWTEGKLTTFTPGCTYARTCMPRCPSRLLHVARDLSDARCSWVRRKNWSAHAHPILMLPNLCFFFLKTDQCFLTYFSKFNICSRATCIYRL